MTTPHKNRHSMTGALTNIRAIGFVPNTVIDVGAALGTFCLYETFPEAHHFLLEPIAENVPYLEKICNSLESAEYMIAAATREPGEITLDVSPNLIHSSIIEDRSSQAQRKITEARTIVGISLDKLCQTKQLVPPYLVKIDVDGKEVTVLEGAVKTLEHTEYVIIECSLFGQIHDVINFMTRHNFVIYDIVDLVPRHLDGALWQCDIAFVKADGAFREHRTSSAPSNQKAAQDSIAQYRQSCIDMVETLYGTPNHGLDFPSLQQEFHLRDNNIVLFPQWNMPEEILLQDLASVISAIAQRPNQQNITLLIDITGIEADAANFFLSNVYMSLMMGDTSASYTDLQVCFLSKLQPRQWHVLLRYVQGRIVLSGENERAIAMAGAQRLPVLSIDQVKTINHAS